MKTTLFVLCLFAATAAFGQATGSTGSATMSSTVQMANHAEHASQHALAQEENLMEHSNVYFGQGEIPLWEAQGPSKVHPVPLGDIARMYRRDHELVKKADIVVRD